MEPKTLMYILLTIAALVIVVGLLTVLFRAVNTRNDGRRAVLSDMMFACMISLFLVYGMFSHTTITYEVVLLAGLFSALSTGAAARIITRGRR